MPLKIDLEPLRVAEGEKLSLAERPTSVAPVYSSKSAYAEALGRHAARSGGAARAALRFRPARGC